MRTLSAPDGDLTTDLQLIDGVESIRQRIEQRLRFFRGEWFLDGEAGTPYYQTILASGAPDSLVEATLVHAAREVEGVQTVRTIEIERSAARTLAVRMLIATTAGDVEVEV